MITKRNILGIAVLLFIVNTAIADDETGVVAASSSEVIKEDESGLDLRGWISAGANWNTSDSHTEYNGPVTFNDESNTAQLDQAYVIAEKKVVYGGDAFSMGGRVDVMYGADSPFTQSIGFDNNFYGSSNPKHQLAIPQAYLEANLPVGTGLSVKAGHFYTLLGYEVVTAPDNFFYSHAYSMQYAEPFTHWGALASYSLSDKVSVTAGGVRGWDNLKDESDGNLAFLGGTTVKVSDSTTAVFSLTSGNQGHNQNLTAYSLVLTHVIDDTWSYVLQHDLGSYDLGSNTAQWYSVNNYLLYELNDLTRLGLRFEWFNDADGTRVAGLRSGSPASESDYFGLTFGAQRKLSESVMFRPEVRYDWQTGATEDNRAFGADKDQLLVSGNVIVNF